MRIDIFGNVMISPRRLLIFLLVFSSLIPDIGVKISTIGFNWTFYRTSILVCILIFLLMKKNGERLIHYTAYRGWLVILTIWLLHGIVLLVLSPYTVLHDGVVELLSLFNGFVCTFILISVIRNKNDVNQILNLIYFVCLFYILIGLFEIKTGYHFLMSRFHSVTVDSRRSQIAATGFFYNENDFSAFITCMMPILLYKRKNIIFTLAGFLGIVYINGINDATICLLAIVIAVGYYFVSIKQYGKHGQIIVRGFILVLAIVIVTYIWGNIDSFANKSALLYAVRTQQKNFINSQGSLYKRVMISVDSLTAAMNTGFLGIGPGAFTYYFLSHPSRSGLVNPHNLYLEILVEYGLIIAGGFVVLLIRMIRGLRKRIQQCKDRTVKRKLIIGCEMILLYSIVCIVSSSFIGYAWQWIVITIGIILMGTPETQLTDANIDYYVISCDPVFPDRSKTP